MGVGRGQIPVRMTEFNAQERHAHKAYFKRGINPLQNRYVSAFPRLFRLIVFKKHHTNSNK